MMTNTRPETNDPKLTREVAEDPILKLFLNSITDQAVFTVDPQGVIATWSEGCRRLYGYIAGEAIGQNFSMLYTLEDRGRGHSEDNLRTALADGLYLEERERLRKGGAPFMAEVSIFPILEREHLAGFAKVVKDVSLRHRLEEERDTFEEGLKRSNLELERFCFAMAHDLHAPIRSIIGKCRIIQEDLAPRLTEEDGKNLDRLIASSQRLAQLVDDLLRFGRVGQAAINRVDIDVSALVRHLAEELLPECQEGTGQIVAQGGVQAFADPTMLEFVLRNLLENSCKYSTARVNVWFGMDLVDGESVYYVRDDGIGFDMQYAAKVFEPFQRLHRNDAYKGTGIGLSSVRHIVSRHGGRVWAESEPGKGATFFFTLCGKPLASDSISNKMATQSCLV